jgi:hypothetical protein
MFCRQSRQEGWRYRGSGPACHAEEGLIFGGAPAWDRSLLDMHQAIGAALRVFETRLPPYFREHPPLKAP